MRLASEGAAVLVTDLDATARPVRPRGYARRAAPPNPWPATSATGTRSTRRSPTRPTPSAGFDVLVNNAYANHDDAALFEDEDDASWEHTLDITLSGPYRCSRAALPHLVKSGRGAIVTIGSVNGEQDFGGHAYSAAKAGLASLTRTLAGHAGPRGVRVNLVAPGTIRTDAWAGRDAALERASALYPLGRIGEPEDIASAVAFLASRDAAWITGTTLRVDGGLLGVNTGFRAAMTEEHTPEGQMPERR